MRILVVVLAGLVLSEDSLQGWKLIEVWLLLSRQNYIACI